MALMAVIASVTRLNVAQPKIAGLHISPQDAENAIKNGEADAVAFGKLFISNPDLAERIRSGSELNELVPERYYFTPIEMGYTDYPKLG